MPPKRKLVHEDDNEKQPKRQRKAKAQGIAQRGKMQERIIRQNLASDIEDNDLPSLDDIKGV